MESIWVRLINSKRFNADNIAAESANAPLN